jgi:GNAT superfamily N-acetyltransferase
MPIEFTGADATELAGLSERVGWRHTPADWRTALASGAVFGSRDEDGSIISSAGIFAYGAELASIGLVIVRPEARRRGLARAAVERCLDVAGARTLMLVATAQGRPLYESLGFRAVEDVETLIAPAGVAPGGACPAMDAGRIPRALELDRQAYGADRGRMLRERWKQSAGAAILEDESGFAWSTLQRDLLILGPLIGQQEDGAARLAGHLARSHAGRVRIDVPVRQGRFMARLAAAGFAHHATRPLMIRGAEALAGERDRIFGLTTLAFG